MNNSIIGGFLYAPIGIAWVAAYDAAIWVLGTILFAFNIATAALTAVALIFGGFFMDLGDLISGRQTFTEIVSGFLNDVGKVVANIVTAVGDFFSGLFSW
jgi:hypothetical protein